MQGLMKSGQLWSSGREYEVMVINWGKGGPCGISRMLRVERKSAQQVLNSLVNVGKCWTGRWTKPHKKSRRKPEARARRLWRQLADWTTVTPALWEQFSKAGRCAHCLRWSHPSLRIHGIGCGLSSPSPSAQSPASHLHGDLHRKACFPDSLQDDSARWERST